METAVGIEEIVEAGLADRGVGRQSASPQVRAGRARWRIPCPRWRRLLDLDRIDAGERRRRLAKFAQEMFDAAALDLDRNAVKIVADEAVKRMPPGERIERTDGIRRPARRRCTFIRRRFAAGRGGGAKFIASSARGRVRPFPRWPRSRRRTPPCLRPSAPRRASVCSRGLTRSALAMQAATSKSRCGSRSDLLSSIRSAAANMSGYLSGLSSPSVTENTTTLCASPRSNAAGQTRLPTFSMNSALPGTGPSVSTAWRDHMRVEMAALAGVDLQRRRAGRPNALGVVGCLLIALDDEDRKTAEEMMDRQHQQARLARPGAGDEIQREDIVLFKEFSVLGGVGVVLRENVALDLNDARFAHAGDMHAREAAAVVDHAWRMAMVMRSWACV